MADHDLTTTDGVVKHITERIKQIAEERQGQSRDGTYHPEIIRAAKETALCELLAESFRKLELLKDLVIAMGDDQNG